MALPISRVQLAFVDVLAYGDVAQVQRLGLIPMPQEPDGSSKPNGSATRVQIPLMTFAPWPNGLITIAAIADDDILFHELRAALVFHRWFGLHAKPLASVGDLEPKREQILHLI